jgi:poly(A) polymerase
MFGRGPGPWLRPLKDYLLSLVIDGVLAPDDKERAAQFAREFVAQQEQQDHLQQKQQYAQEQEQRQQEEQHEGVSHAKE